MSMHLRGSKDMMGRDESWWQSRTGLEQKLVILSTILFILSFSLTISVIVLKNRSTSGDSDATTISPTEITGDGSTVSGETPVTEATEPETQSTESSVTESEPSQASGQTTASAEPATEATSASTLSPEATTEPTTVTEPTSEATTPIEPKKVEASGPRSINSRPARYIPSPRGLANLHGEVLGA